MRRRSECRPASFRRDESQHPECFQDADLRGPARRLERRSQDLLLAEQELKYFRTKLENLGLTISGNVADFARGKSEPGLAARSRTVAGGCSGGRAARALVDSAADTAAATDKSCGGSAVPSGDAIEPRIRRHYLTSSKGLLEADMAAATENEKSGCEQPNNSAVRTLST